jgi:hypothetical protein
MTHNPTLDEVVQLGLTHRKGGRGPCSREILTGSTVVFTGTAHETWAWLHATAAVCPCGAVHAWQQWYALEMLGPVDPVLLAPHEDSEQRNCTCGSTLTVDVARRFAKPSRPGSCPRCRAMSRGYPVESCGRGCRCVCH